MQTKIIQDKTSGKQICWTVNENIAEDLNMKGKSIISKLKKVNFFPLLNFAGIFFLVWEISLTLCAFSLAFRKETVPLSTIILIIIVLTIAVITNIVCIHLKNICTYYLIYNDVFEGLEPHQDYFGLCCPESKEFSLFIEDDDVGFSTFTDNFTIQEISGDRTSENEIFVRINPSWCGYTLHAWKYKEI